MQGIPPYLENLGSTELKGKMKFVNVGEKLSFPPKPEIIRELLLL